MLMALEAVAAMLALNNAVAVASLESCPDPQTEANLGADCE